MGKKSWDVPNFLVKGLSSEDYGYWKPLYDFKARAVLMETILKHEKQYM